MKLTFLCLDSADIRESTETLPELQNLSLNKSPVNDTDCDNVGKWWFVRFEYMILLMTMNNTTKRDEIQDKPFNIYQNPYSLK
jgi:hypothetical protein